MRRPRESNEVEPLRINREPCLSIGQHRRQRPVIHGVGGVCVAQRVVRTQKDEAEPIGGISKELERDESTAARIHQQHHGSGPICLIFLRKEESIPLSRICAGFDILRCLAGDEA